MERIGLGDLLLRGFPGVHDKAAVHCSRILRYHPFPDGNKRVAYDVMIEFIERNGRTFAHPAGGLDETAETIENTAAGTVSEEEFRAWVADRVS
jgi:death-on-curing protein